MGLHANLDKSLHVIPVPSENLFDMVLHDHPFTVLIEPLDPKPYNFRLFDINGNELDVGYMFSDDEVDFVHAMHREHVDKYFFIR